jgi:DNA-binding MarR family transcriptional regulator
LAEELLRETKDLMAEVKKMVKELLEEEKRSHRAREEYYRQTAEGAKRCAELLEELLKHRLQSP